MVLAASVAACDGDDGDQGPAGPPGAAGQDGAPGAPGQDGADGAPGLARAVFYRSNNGTGNAGTADRISQNAGLFKQFNSGNNEGIGLDVAGSLLHAGDGPADGTAGSFRTVCTIADRSDGGGFAAGIDRDVAGANTGFVNPKGFAVAHGAGLVFIANVGGNSISVFGTGAAGDVAPLAESSLSANPWDVAYDEPNDRLFVAMTDGTALVFDGYVANGFADTPDRIVTPVDGNGTQISVNLHGIVYEPASDRLVVSDVGSAMDATDGQIFVIGSAASASGNVQPQRVIGGPASLLGNPVDIVLSGTDLRVAEKSNDFILVFSDIFGGASGDIAPDLAVASTKPESLVEALLATGNADVSDIVDDGELLLGVAVTSNPATAGPTSMQVSRVSTALSAELASFASGVSLENVSFDLTGDAYLSFDDGSDMNGGIRIVNRLAKSRDGATFSASRDRDITGAQTGLVSPKGVDVATMQGLVLVAENNATSPGVLVFSTCTAGNSAPLLTLVPASDARPWDVDYDPTTDRAFVALTNGTVAVFDDVLAAARAGVGTVAGESRLITPATGSVAMAAPTNLHGVHFDLQSDSLIVSDVGSAADATDGKLYVIPAASTATGLTDVVVNIAGAATQLGNPVDISFDGADLFVAEKANNLLLRFDDVLESAGGNVAPSIATAFTAPESVALIPAYLSLPPGE